MGASGSGKSTLMNIIGCLDVGTAGRYLLDGIDVRRLDERQLSLVRNRKIGFIFQSFNLSPARRRSATSSSRSPTPGSGRPSARSAPRPRWPGSAWPTGRTTCRPSCPVASSSGWRSPGRSSPSPSSCWPTSRPGPGQPQHRRRPRPLRRARRRRSHPGGDHPRGRGRRPRQAGGPDDATAASSPTCGRPRSTSRHPAGSRSRGRSVPARRGVRS